MNRRQYTDDMGRKHDICECQACGVWVPWGRMKEHRTGADKYGPNCRGAEGRAQRERAMRGALQGLNAATSKGMSRTNIGGGR